MSDELSLFHSAGNSTRDVRPVTRGLEDHRVANLVDHVSDGETALDFLFRPGECADPEKNPRLHSVLLDIRLPNIDGLEVLRQDGTSEQVKKIPTVILTMLDAETDVAKPYEYRASSYPAELSGLRGGQGLVWLDGNQHLRL